MDMKESFESWWLAKVEKEIGFPLEKGMELNYGNSEIDLAWSAWSASRESLVVDLPRSFCADYCNGDPVFDAEEVMFSISKAGAKYK